MSVWCGRQTFGETFDQSQSKWRHQQIRESSQKWNWRDPIHSPQILSIWKLFARENGAGTKAQLTNTNFCAKFKLKPYLKIPLSLIFWNFHPEVLKAQNLTISSFWKCKNFSTRTAFIWSSMRAVLSLTLFSLYWMERMQDDGD